MKANRVVRVALIEVGVRLAGGIALFLASGCASLPYAPTTCDEADRMPLRESEAQVERGRPNAFVDGLGHYLVSLPTKLLLLSWSVENHDVSPETEAALAEYVSVNELCHVKVRINQYSVPGEWSRLFRNRNVAGGWRYTVGFLTVVTYTALPQRVFGGDNYNPYTNTIHIYSDVESVALHEGGHAKDFATRRHKGSYGALRLLPLVPLYQEGKATKDAVSYLRNAGEAEAERKAYPMLWGAYGTYVAGEGLRWYEGPFGVSYLIQLPIAWTGKLAGKIKSWTVPEPAPPPPQEPPPVEEPPLAEEPPAPPEESPPLEMVPPVTEDQQAP